MIEIQVKRKYGNRSITKGVLTIPQFDFTCNTLELADSKDLMYMQNCRLPEGIYQMVRGFASLSPTFPVLRKKPRGFSKKPEFCFTGLHYLNLWTGFIGLGIDNTGDLFSISESKEVEKTFKVIFREVFNERRKEIVALNLWKSRNYIYDDVSYDQYMYNEEGETKFAVDDDE